MVCTCFVVAGCFRLLLLQATLFLVFYLDPMNLLGERKYRKSDFNASTAKTILYYTPMHEHLDFEFGFGHQPFVVYNCPVHNCIVTNNKSFLGSTFF
jgi:hypothetical protein